MRGLARAVQAGFSCGCKPKQYARVSLSRRSFSAVPEPINEERQLSLLRRGFSAMPVDSIEPGQDGSSSSFEGFDGSSILDERFLIQYREHRNVRP